MSSEYKFEIEVPQEILSDVLIDTGVRFQETLKINITYEDGKYIISELDDRIVINNTGIALLEGNIFEGSLDIYPNEEI